MKLSITCDIFHKMGSIGWLHVTSTIIYYWLTEKTELMIRVPGKMLCGLSHIDKEKVTRLLATSTPSLLGRIQVIPVSLWRDNSPSIPLHPVLNISGSLLLICEHKNLQASYNCVSSPLTACILTTFPPRWKILTSKECHNRHQQSSPSNTIEQHSSQQPMEHSLKYTL